MKLVLAGVALSLAGCGRATSKRDDCRSRRADTRADEKAAGFGGLGNLGLEQKDEGFVAGHVAFGNRPVLPGRSACRRLKTRCTSGREIGGYVFTRWANHAIRISQNDSNPSTLTVFAKAGEFRPTRAVPGSQTTPYNLIAAA
jgi:hypothetical protein